MVPPLKERRILWLREANDRREEYTTLMQQQMELMLLARAKPMALVETGASLPPMVTRLPLLSMSNCCTPRHQPDERSTLRENSIALGTEATGVTHRRDNFAARADTNNAH